MPLTVPNSISEESVLWRYMDLAKLIYLLSTGYLYLTRTDRLGDRFEGTISKSEYEFRDALIESMVLADLKSTGVRTTEVFDYNTSKVVVDRENIPPDEVRKRLRLFYEEASRAHANSFFISCWHRNNAESAAMWKLYGSAQQCVAVKSTVGSLRRSLETDSLPLSLHAVTYVETDSKQWKDSRDVARVLYKHESFKHEDELRITGNLPPAIKKMGGDVWGFTVNVDIPTLVHEVMIGPDLPSYFGEAVKTVMDKFAPSVSLTNSALSRQAYY